MTIIKRIMSIRLNDTVLIIGATSSLAQAICRTLAKRGCHLVLMGRDESELELLAGDIKTRSSVECRIVLADLMEPGFAAEHCIAQAGAFDHAIIATGEMGSGNPDDLDNLVHVTAVNYILPAQLATVIAAQMAERKHGTLALISSVAGDRGRASNYPYGSAKAALTSFASGLRNRYAKQGVQVMTLKPGFIDTPMTWGMKSKLIASRESVAEKIVAAMDKNKDAIYVPCFWGFIMLVIRHIPERVFKKLRL